MDDNDFNVKHQTYEICFTLKVKDVDCKLSIVKSPISRPRHILLMLLDIVVLVSANDCSHAAKQDMASAPFILYVTSNFTKKIGTSNSAKKIILF